MTNIRKDDGYVDMIGRTPGTTLFHYDYTLNRAFDDFEEACYAYDRYKNHLIRMTFGKVFCVEYSDSMGCIFLE